LEARYNPPNAKIGIANSIIYTREENSHFDLLTRVSSKCMSLFLINM
jgi:hypothetical protein